MRVPARHQLLAERAVHEREERQRGQQSLLLKACTLYISALRFKSLRSLAAMANRVRMRAAVRKIGNTWRAYRRHLRSIKELRAKQVRSPVGCSPCPRGRLTLPCLCALPKPPQTPLPFPHSVCECAVAGKQALAWRRACVEESAGRQVLSLFFRTKVLRVRFKRMGQAAMVRPPSGSICAPWDA